MNLKKFEMIINTIKEDNAWIHSAYELGIDMLDVPNRISRVCNIFFEEIYGKLGADLIEWWLYENVEKAIIENNATGPKHKINLKTTKQLWNYLETNYNKKEKSK